MSNKKEEEILRATVLFRPDGNVSFPGDNQSTLSEWLEKEKTQARLTDTDDLWAKFRIFSKDSHEVSAVAFLHWLEDNINK
jgi:hypothetical protein